MRQPSKLRNHAKRPQYPHFPARLAARGLSNAGGASVRESLWALRLCRPECVAMLHETKAQMKLRLGALLEAWSSADIAGLAASLADDVVFASPFTEQIDAQGLTRGKRNVLQRLSLERDRFDGIEIVDILLGEASLVVLLRAGETELSCLIEIDDQARFRRLIASLSDMTPL